MTSELRKRVARGPRNPLATKIDDVFWLDREFEAYLGRLNVSEKSIPNYRATSRQFLQFLRIGGRSVKDATAVDEFLAGCRGRMKAHDFYSRVAELRLFFEFAVEEKMVDSNPLGRGRGPRWRRLQRQEEAYKNKQSEVVVAVSTFNQPVAPSRAPEEADMVRELKNEIAFVKSEIRRLTDALRRQREMLQDEIDFLTNGLDRNQWESYDAVKRRISRLKGAVQYRGVSDLLLCGNCSRRIGP